MISCKEPIVENQYPRAVMRGISQGSYSDSKAPVPQPTSKMAASDRGAMSL